MATQLALPVGVRDSASFANYFPGPNREALHALQQLALGDEQYTYVWGAAGSGKSHLLHAACQAVSAQGGAAAYLPLRQFRELSPALVDGLEDLTLVCVDDMQAIAGVAEWETALFHLYNRLRENGASLLVAANASPPELGLLLPDLVSRLSWGLVLQLHELNDTEKLAALRLSAAGRGIELPEDVACFLLHRCPRDLPALFALLAHLDQASLANQRKLTIPFVRELIQRRG